MSGLVPTSTLQKVRRVCSRCKGPHAEGHVCHDRLRHPRFTDLLDALARSVQVAQGAQQLHDRMEAGGMSEVPLAPAEADAFEAVLEVALIWEYLPDWERVVVNAVLEHAGVPPLAA